MNCKAVSRALALTLLVVGLGFTGVGCSGGNGGGGGAAFVVTNLTVDRSLEASNGVVCFSITIKGPANTLFDLLARYAILSGNGLQVPMTEVPAALQASLGITSDGLTGHNTGATGSVTITFCWTCGQDLSFLLPSPTIQAAFTAFSNGDPANPDGATRLENLGLVSCTNPPTPVPASPNAGPTQNVPVPGFPGGVPTPVTAFRGTQTAHDVRASTAPTAGRDSVLVVGGVGDPVGAENARDSATKMEFEPPVADTDFPFPGSVRRALHASSFYLDPTTNVIRVVITGGVRNVVDPGLNPGPPDLLAMVQGSTEEATTDQFSLDSTTNPVGTLSAGPNLPGGPRYAHSATWTPSNHVYLIGGARGTSAPSFTPLSDIVMFDPVANTFTASTATLGAPRVLHTATLLGDGRILVFGGFDPNAPTVQPPMAIFDPSTSSVMTVTAPASVVLGRSEHTATRLMDGRVLVMGGRDLNGALLDQALIIDPMNSFGVTPISQDAPRSEHEATLLGNGQVLVSGGVTPLPPAMGGVPEGGFTQIVISSSTVVFNPSNFGLGTAFTTVNALLANRAGHTATPSGSGSVYIIGGRNGTGPNPFLLPIEVFAFSNAVPSVPTAATATAGIANMLNVTFDVTDANGDGGYAFLRWREPNSPSFPAWNNATVNTQITPSGTTVTPPTFQIGVGTNTFVWNFAADGVSIGTVVELQILPVGAVIGSPTTFLAAVVP